MLLLPALADLPETWDRLRSGDGRWLLLALAFEAVSFFGHILLFRAVSRDASPKVTLRASTEITLAGHAATRLLAPRGRGRHGDHRLGAASKRRERATVAVRMTTFMVLLYGSTCSRCSSSGSVSTRRPAPRPAPARADDRAGRLRRRS